MFHKKPLITNGNWYRNPVIYDFFSRAEDPDNICFGIVKKRLAGHRIINPIDLATGTGRMLGLLNELDFEGKLYGIDKSKQMCQFVKNYYKAEIITAGIEKIATLGVKSTLIVSCFGFPSKVWDKKLAQAELNAVKKVLEPDGVFITIGWNERFDCELSEMWYRFVPDDVNAQNFAEWRRIRASKITSPRNCHLTWLKRDIRTFLRFSCLQESAFVMGHLFGEEAMRYIIENNLTKWEMKMGITYDICKKLKSYTT